MWFAGYTVRERPAGEEIPDLVQEELIRPILADDNRNGQDVMKGEKQRIFCN